MSKKKIFTKCYMKKFTKKSYAKNYKKIFMWNNCKRKKNLYKKIYKKILCKKIICRNLSHFIPNQHNFNTHFR